MSSLSVNRYRRRPSNDQTWDDEAFGNDFELFDPWTHANVRTPASFRWINQPKSHKEYEGKIAPALQLSKNGEKYRVKLDVSAFEPETIKTNIEGRLLVVEAQKKHHHGKEQKMYDLPENVYEHAGQSYFLLRKLHSPLVHLDAEHLVSYITPNHTLIVDIPLRNHEQEQHYLQSSSEASGGHHLLPYGQHRDQSFNYHHFHTSAFSPKVVGTEGHQKKLQMSLPMKHYHPEHIKVSLQHNNLVVQGEHIPKDKAHSDKTVFYKSIILPPGTQTDHLQSHLTHDGVLQIEAPFLEHNPKH